jgi:hypothetical protein
MIVFSSCPDSSRYSTIRPTWASVYSLKPANTSAIRENSRFFSSSDRLSGSDCLASRMNRNAWSARSLDRW